MDNYVKHVVMKKSEDLYGVPGTHFRDMTYIDALQTKIELARKIAEELIEVPFNKRDTARITRCLTSVEFNKKLIKELRGEI